MRKLFRNDKLDREFKKYGYVSLPLLGNDAVYELYQFYLAMKSETENSSFHSTHFSTNFEYKQKVHDKLKQIIEPESNELLIGYRIVFANFMIKNAGGNNPMPLHADWSYVKEPDEISIAVWIPLVDTTDQNGYIGVIPYSQHISPTIRGPRLLQWNPPSEVKLIDSMGKLLPLKAGCALVYDHRLLHYSPANNTNVDRPAINISLAPLDVPLFHNCVPDGTDEIHEFAVDDDGFFIRYNNFKMPETGKLIAKHPIQSVPVIDGRVDDFIKKYNITKWWKKPFALLASLRN